MSFDRKPYPVLHAGVTGNGEIVISRGDGYVSFLDDRASLDEMLRRGTRAILGVVGGPWLAMPGKSEHQVIGKLDSGRKVTALMGGWVYNDAALVDALCGPGTYERVMPPEEVAVLQLARPLYRAVAS